MQAPVITYVDIPPIQRVQVATKMSIRVIQYEIFEYALCQINLYSADSSPIMDRVVKVEGDDFNVRWNTDQDLIAIVIEKLSTFVNEEQQSFS